MRWPLAVLALSVAALGATAWVTDDATPAASGVMITRFDVGCDRVRLGITSRGPAHIEVKTSGAGRVVETVAIPSGHVDELLGIHAPGRFVIARVMDRGTEVARRQVECPS